MSSRYPIVYGTFPMTFLIISWKYVGACANLNGTLLNSYFPNGVTIVVFALASGAYVMWQYPLQRSKVVKKFAPFSFCVHFILGSGCRDRFPLFFLIYCDCLWLKCVDPHTFFFSLVLLFLISLVP